ncbi:MAG: all-trans-retinol 13,14-reductase [Hyphomicrobiaceae bacterium]|jgi:all-trans-retinol 13,14-reductase
MLRSLIHRRLDVEENKLGESVDYIRHVVDVSPGAFLRFASIMPFANSRKDLPKDAWFVAQIVASQAEDREVYRAPVVISDAGAWATYAKLLPPKIGAARARELEGLGAAPTGVTVYLGLKRSAAELGLRGENYWINEQYSHDASTETEGCLAGRPTGAYVSFPSLKDPHSDQHTAEILCMLDYEPFARWSDARWHHRGQDYEAMKERIADGMLAMVDRHLPGLAALVRYREVSTPLSVEHFTDWRGGAIYGLPPTP